MVIYLPVLKGRDGEFKALSNLSASLVPHLLPIFEVVPSERGPTRDAYAFVEKVWDAAPPDLSVAVDLQYLEDPSDGIRRPLHDIGEDLAARGVPMLPVLHLADSPQRLADAGTAARLHAGHAVLRLGGAAMDPNDEEAEAQLDRIARYSGLSVERCALVLDFFEIRSERDVSRVEPIVRKCVSWAQRRPWQSITVASGAMPENISDLPTNAATPLRRWDRLLWERIRDLDVQYGDYGIAHPKMTGGGWPPNPNIRYTADESWWVYRWVRDKATNAAVYDMCKALVAAGHWPGTEPSFCWGDNEIALRAAGRAGPGNPTSWRAWGTSRHLAFIVDELTETIASRRHRGEVRPMADATELAEWTRGPIR